MTGEGRGEPPIVLCVEDNEDDAALAELAFARTRIPHRLVLARDGTEALDYLFARGRWRDRTPDERPALALVDLKLPLVGGHDVLHAMHADPRTSRVPAVVLSSSDLAQDVALSYREGARGFLRKPISFSAFEDWASVLLYYWLGFDADTPGATTADALPAEATTLVHAVLERWRGRRDARPPADHILLGSPRERPVLVVDGDPAHLDLTIRAIGPWVGQREILGVTGGAEAEALLAPTCDAEGPRRGSPGLVMVDLDRPGEDGLALIGDLRRVVGHQVVVVALAACVDHRQREACHGLGINSLVRKPESPEAYRAQAALTALYWVGLNVPPPLRPR